MTLNIDDNAPALSLPRAVYSCANIEGQREKIATSIQSINLEIQGKVPDLEGNAPSFSGFTLISSDSRQIEEMGG